MKSDIVLTIVALTLTCVYAQKNPYFVDNHTTIVHLFEWKWVDIANECENFLGPKGFGGVQISPPNENLIIQNRVWWERYQPISYKLTTRSGDENELSDMIKRCRNSGVNIYVDTVINHMSALSGTGTAGTPGNSDTEEYPGVPFAKTDFHNPCSITNSQDPENMRNCELNGLRDLDQSKDYVREKLIEYMDHLVDLGVAGFRIDAAKLMWPVDLEYIFSKVKNLNTNLGFPANARPFIFQEVIDMGDDPISKYEYNSFASVLEFRYGMSLSNVFQGGDKVTYLENFGPEWGLLDSLDAVAFIDNHDNQRTGGGQILTYKQDKQYKMAIAFMLAHPYGTTRIMSSYYFNDNDQPPPHDDADNLLSPGFNEDGTCTNGYVCEHRWRQIYNMVAFRNAAYGTDIKNWWSNGDQQIAFGRGDKAFIAFTNNGGTLDQVLQTGLPAGTYCDVISGGLYEGKCSGKSVDVGSDGKAKIYLADDEYDGVVAIHVNNKL